VSVALQHVAIKFKSEYLYILDTEPTPSSWGLISGLYKASDGYIYIHDLFPNHQECAKSLLDCSLDTSYKEILAKVAAWRIINLESAVSDLKLVTSALWSYTKWDILP
jgi:hypothetical protein